MPTMQVNFRLFIYLFVASFLLSGCLGGSKLGNANKAYLIGEYDRAATQFKKAYRKADNNYTKGEISYYLGECYRKTNKPRKATMQYARAVRYNYEMADAGLYLGDCYLASQKYEDAIEAYEEYLQKVPRDKRAQNGLAACKLAMKDTLETRYNIEKLKKVNNTRYSDFSPGYASTSYDQIYFSSMRTEKKKRKKSRITGQGGTNIFMAKMDAKGEWTDPEPLDETINTEFDEGSATMSGDGKEMYFTRCRYDNEQPRSAEMYMVSRSGGKWGEPVQLEIGGDSLLVAHPAISHDGETLYFVSDMPGGYGGKDIWKTTKGGEGGWGQPVNMGSVINTAGDEVFPSVRMDGSLYFSSNAHIGYGGLDIYRAVFDEEKEDWDVYNLGRPLNSEGDDFGIAFKGMEEAGLLSSSRGSSKGIDNIYAFSLPKLEFSMKGLVYSEKTDEPLADAYLRLIGTDGTNIKLNIRNDGSFGAKLAPQTEYVFMVASKGYFNHKHKLSTIGLGNNKEFNIEVGMLPMEDAIVFRNIRFSKDQFDLNTNSKQELNRLAAIMNLNKKIVLDIVAHASGEGSESEAIVLSQKRAESVMSYLMSKGIPTERLSAKGVGSSEPVTVSKRQAKKLDFLKEGDVLYASFIKRLRGNANKEAAHNLNRRIEFKIKE
ncbi:PD40 domain-containing protein [Carboxylicivirga mesophila]|uniref:PD40 domain-containing protein n=1 Tax=Carboxylicivirga mesophila TaxID=1166478 RepID=A0ABS5KDK4_9BACT|nr:OmpA family protein [Carboxylicivirga mesophila]MBS2212917.1 PD40 domain-containing protein [Carboxylicivirga mesophila]